MAKEKMRIWISAGEISADIHAAELVQKMKQDFPDAEFMGLGGDALRSAGVEIKFDMKILSLIGITEILTALPRVLALLRRVKRSLRNQKPDALIVLDSSAFHLRIIPFAHALNIPVYYYILPQVWVWRAHRAKTLAKYARKCFCILPFEEGFLRKYDCDTQYFGSPLLDEIPLKTLANKKSKKKCIGILAGSRKREVETLMPEIAKAMKTLREQDPKVSFSIILAPNVKAETISAYLPKDFQVDFHETANRYAAMKACEFVIAASGTVVLEAALLNVPAIVCYKVSTVTAFLLERMASVKMVSLPNIILGYELLPELLQSDMNSTHIVRAADMWLCDDQKLIDVKKSLELLHEIMGERGATQKVAEEIVKDLRSLEE